jgi:hypothetical protein
MEEWKERPRFIPMTCMQEVRVRFNSGKDLAPLPGGGGKSSG